MNLTAELDINGAFNTALKSSFDQLPVKECKGNGQLPALKAAIGKFSTFLQNIPEGGTEIMGNPITGNLEELVTLHKMKSNDCSLIHRFSEGCYIREILMPKSSIVVGKVHKTEHFNVILEGSVTVITLDGANRYEAPSTFISKPGVQKVVVMHEECRWQTVHVTNETDIPTIESMLVTEDYDKFETEQLMKVAKELI